MLAGVALTDHEFSRIRELLYSRCGISLSANKKPLVTGRLGRRLDRLGMRSYSDYLRHIEALPNQAELRQAIDLLTTNETYFWREPVHFDHLRAFAGRPEQSGRELAVWSAACSSGEEVYSIAMVLQQGVEQGARYPWRVLGSDISERMLQRAVKGHYPAERAQRLPPDLLKRFCLRGIGEQAGTLLIERPLRESIRFAQINLIEPLPDVGEFDVIFLRNVLIYFDPPTKQQVVRALCRQLRPGGLLVVGLAESLNGVRPGLEALAPGLYRRSGR